jgi:hypothetical protein
MKVFILCASLLLLTGCSVMGHSGVENAPYSVLQTVEKEAIEIRRYDQMILVSTTMDGGMDSNKKDAFGKLFDYISGNNANKADIEMTAPVFVDNAQESGQKIPMTAPVFMDGENDNFVMSFVMPASFTLETTPAPLDPAVHVDEITNYTVAAITFNGFLNQDNVDKHRGILETWIADNGYKAAGPYKAAGYNPPFTIPAFRRNEVLIPVVKLDL